ncbi:MAG: hypothetical protein ABSG22_10565 [Sedimentisphaerales bacterium]
MAKHQVDIVIQGYDRASRELSDIERAFSSAFTTIAGGFGAYQIGSFIEDSIKEYAQLEQQMLRLAGVLGVDAASAAQKYAGELEKLTGIHDMLIVKAMGLGAQLGHLSGEQLQKATEAAIGWSTILQKDLETTMRMVAKAAEGNYIGFTRLGMKFDDCSSQTERFNKVLTEGNRGFIVTQEMAKGTQGQIDRLSNSWKDLKENVGNITTGPSVFVMKQLSGLFYMLGTGRTSPEGQYYLWGSKVKQQTEQWKDIAKGTGDALDVLRQYVDKGDDAVEKTDAQIKGAKEYTKAMAELNREIETFGDTAGGKKYYDLKMLGVNPEDLAKYNKDMFDLEQMTKAKDLTKAIDDSFLHMETSIDTFGKSKGFTMLYEMLLKGAKIKDIQFLIPWAEKLQGLEDKAKIKPYDPTPGLAPFEMGKMRGWASPNQTINYDAQIAKSSQESTSLLQQIKVVLDNIHKAGRVQPVNIEDLEG